MSLHLYMEDKSEFRGKQFVADVDSYFNLSVALPDTSEVRKILDYMEHATYRDTTTFTDRFGAVLYTRNLSTSTKALLCILLKPEIVFDCSEIGDNALIYLLGFTQGHAYFAYRLFEAHTITEVTRIDVDFEGKHFDSPFYLDEYLEGLADEV